MMSCRAMGRGVIEALLAWLAPVGRPGGRGDAGRAVPGQPQERAAAAGAGRVPASGPAAGSPPGQRPAVFSRPLSGPLPELPELGDRAAGGGAGGVTEP